MNCCSNFFALPTYSVQNFYRVSKFWISKSAQLANSSEGGWPEYSIKTGDSENIGHI